MKDRTGGRRIKILFLVTALFMLCAVPVHAQASAKSVYKKAVASYQNAEYKAARQQFKTLRKQADESCVKTMSAKMKRAYLKKTELYPEFDPGSTEAYLWGYYLTDIDKDGKAELIIKYGTCEADCTASVYQYTGGKAKKIGSFGCAHSNFYYDPRGNGMTVRCTHMLVEEIYTVKIKNGRLKISYWRGKARKVSSASGYMYLPYALDSHESNLTYDYSDLK